MSQDVGDAAFDGTSKGRKPFALKPRVEKRAEKHDRIAPTMMKTREPRGVERSQTVVEQPRKRVMLAGFSKVALAVMVVVVAVVGSGNTELVG